MYIYRPCVCIYIVCTGTVRLKNEKKSRNFNGTFCATRIYRHCARGFLSTCSSSSVRVERVYLSPLTLRLTSIYAYGYIVYNARTNCKNRTDPRRRRRRRLCSSPRYLLQQHNTLYNTISSNGTNKRCSAYIEYFADI